MAMTHHTFRMRQTHVPPPYGEWRNHTRVNYGVLSDYKSQIIKTKTRKNGFRPMTNHSAGVARGNLSYPVVGTCEYKMAYGLFIETENPTSLYLPSILPDLGLEGGYTPTASEINLLKIAARAKVKDQKINAAMTLLGAKSTLQAITSRLNSLHKFVRDVRSGNLVRALSKMKRYHRDSTASAIDKYRNLNHKAGKPLAKMWLEVNFVHMQVYSDVKGLYDEFQKQVGLPFIHGRSAKVDLSDKVRSVKTGNLGLYGSAAAVAGVVEVKKLHYCQLSYSIDNETLKRASSLGLTNVPFILWDATPMSYIADWVWPFGQYLQAMDATLGMTFEGGCIGSIRSAKGVLRECPTDEWNPGGPSTPISGGFTATIDFKEYRRDVLIDDDISVPGLKNPLSGLAWKAATISALIVGAVNKPQTKPWR